MPQFFTGQNTVDRVVLIVVVLLLCVGALTPALAQTPPPSSSVGDSPAEKAPARTPEEAQKPPLTKPYGELEKQGQGGGDVAAESVRLVVSLVVVAGLVYLAVWVLRKFSQRSPLLAMLSIARSGRGNIKLLETFHLAPTKSLHLLEFGGELYLIGSTPQNIGVLARVSDPEQVAAMRQAASRGFGFGRELEPEVTPKARESKNARSETAELAAKLEQKIEAYRRSRKTD